MLRVVMCGEECADIRNVIIVVIINNAPPRAPVAGRWWNSKGRDNAANFVYEPGALLNSSHLLVLVMGGTAQTRQIGSPNIALKRMFVAAGRTHLIRKRTGRSMRISNVS